jgi:hypothetical protein
VVHAFNPPTSMPRVNTAYIASTSNTRKTAGYGRKSAASSQWERDVGALERAEPLMHEAPDERLGGLDREARRRDAERPGQQVLRVEDEAGNKVCSLGFTAAVS